MTSVTPRSHGAHAGDGALRHEEWLDHTRVFLQPIAAPSIRGLFGFAGAWGRTVLPFGEGGRDALQYELGEPCVRRGQ